MKKFTGILTVVLGTEFVFVNLRSPLSPPVDSDVDSSVAESPSLPFYVQVDGCFQSFRARDFDY